VKDGKQRITATANDDSDAIEKPVTCIPTVKSKRRRRATLLAAAQRSS